MVSKFEPNSEEQKPCEIQSSFCVMIAYRQKVRSRKFIDASPVMGSRFLPVTHINREEQRRTTFDPASPLTSSNLKSRSDSEFSSTEVSDLIQTSVIEPNECSQTGSQTFCGEFFCIIENPAHTTTIFASTHDKSSILVL
jgi:hypothetical protein